MRQWDQWGHYIEGMGVIFIPLVVRYLLSPLSVFEPMIFLALLALIASPNTHNRGFNLPSAAHIPSPPSLPAHALILVMCDITVDVKKVTQNPAVLAS